MRIIVDAWRPFTPKQRTIHGVSLLLKYISGHLEGRLVKGLTILNIEIRVRGEIDQARANLLIGRGILVRDPEVALLPHLLVQRRAFRHMCGRRISLETLSQAKGIARGMR